MYTKWVFNHSNFPAASICFVVLRIVSYAVQYEQGHMEYLFPKGADY